MNNRIGIWKLSAFICTVVLVATTSAFAQLRAPNDRLQNLEKQNARLEKRLAAVEEELVEVKKSKKGNFADGIDTGPAIFRLNGKIELNLTDAESDSFVSLAGDRGSTREPDPHFDFQRFRLAPSISLDKAGEWTISGQLDFRPDGGDTVLKEAALHHRVKPVWWLRSRAQIGVDDRFIRPNRRTKTYPLIGNAFWRDETFALIWQVSFGDPDGRPDDEMASVEEVNQSTGTEGFDSGPTGGKARAGAFDFVNNWGQIQLTFSIGQGFVLDENEVFFDGARFNNIVQDDRDLDNDLSLSELGVGVGYRRNFSNFGDLRISGFVYDDEVRDATVLFFRNSLTLFDPGGGVTAGYGLSNSRRSYRYGATLDYFLPASSFIPEEWFETRKREGLRVLAQVIRGVDGEFRREGWFAQLSYSLSFGKNPLFLDKYIRSLEPIVRYGGLQTNLLPHPALPGTWDRQQLTVGGIVEVTKEIFFKVEYAMQMEDTGGSETGLDRDSVDNDELLIQLLVEF